MNDALKWEVPKWPFITAQLLLVVGGYIFAVQAPHAIRHWEVFVVCVALGAGIGIIPFILDYRAMGKVIEINALGAVAEKIQNLDQFCAQISAATGRWAAVQEFVGENAEKTATSARQIADKMGAEVREFSEFMKKMNDSEKAAMRLEVEKLRRGESEWLQVLVRILDHTFAMHVAAVRSDQPKVAEQISQFQNACQGAVRRLGLNGYVAQPNEPFDAARHKPVDTKQPAEGAVISETLALGYTFQGKMLRPALVHVREETPAPAAPETESSPETPAESPEISNASNGAAPSQDTLALEAD
ncbi:MAG TPA: nucleotide exchange factor GrpE [Verrucomicrobiae bacterium]|jgi:molecular chaperone GrpE (heat shock protein)|nr:nucleotide exchange factor GrpE [Verrucomicrobiae bacterium]